MGQDNNLRKLAGHNNAKSQPIKYSDSPDPGSDSYWDPNPSDLSAVTLSAFEPTGCKMLLLEVLRRAAHDWVLYRHSTRLQQKQIADDAFQWLFVEQPGTAAWIERSLNKKELTSFLSVCDVLSLDPSIVRAYVRRLTLKEILSTGRPPTYRRQKERRNKPELPAHVVAPIVIPVLIPPKNASPCLASLCQKAQQALQLVKKLVTKASPKLA